MAISSLRRLEDNQFAAPENHDVVSLLPSQKQGTEEAAKQIAVIHEGNLQPSLVALFDHARNLGALASVRLIAVEDTQLYLFLDDRISSSCFPAIKALWQQAADASDDKPWFLAFSNIDEVVTGRSDYAFWAYARKIYDSLIKADIPPPEPDASPSPPPLNVLSLYLPQHVKDMLLEKTSRRANTADALDHLDSYTTAHSTITDKAPVDSSDSLPSIQVQCIYALLDAGIRPQELRRIKVGHDFDMRSKCLKVVRHKTRSPYHFIRLTEDTTELLTDYISASGLSPETYLLPSFNSSNAKMSQRKPQSIWRLRQLTSQQIPGDEISLIEVLHRKFTNTAIVAHMFGHAPPPETYLDISD